MTYILTINFEALMRTFCIRSVIFLLGFVAVASLGQAQTYTWTGTTNSNWSTATNWDANGIPQSGSGTVIALNGTSNTTSTFDLTSSPGSPFVLNSLTTNQAFTVNPASGSSINLSFNGAGAGILRDITAPATSQVVRINAQTLNIASATTFNAGNAITSFTDTGLELIVSGRLTGSGNLQINGNTSASVTQQALNDTVLTGLGSTVPTNSTYSGTLSSSFGYVHLGSANILSRTSTASVALGNVTAIYLGTPVSTTTGFATAASFNQQLGSLTSTGTGSGNGALFSLGDKGGATAATALVGFNNSNDTFGGNIAVSSTAAVAQNSHFGKVGTGSLTLTSASPLNSATFSIRDGSVIASSGTTSTGFTASTAGLMQIYAGGEFRQNAVGTASNGSVGNTTAIALSGGSFRLDASGLGSSASGYSDVIGQLQLVSGQSTIRIDTSAVRGSRLNFTGFAQTNPTATLFIQSGNLGGAVLNTVGSGNVTLTSLTGTGLTAVATYNSAATNYSILSSGFGSTTATGDPSSFLFYNTGTSSLRLLADTNYASALGTAADNVSLNATANVATPTTANALRLTTGGSVANSSTLTLTSGALLNNGGGDVTGTGTLNFGAAGASTAYITTNGAFNISNAISAANLSKTGLAT